MLRGKRNSLPSLPWAQYPTAWSPTAEAVRGNCRPRLIVSLALQGSGLLTFEQHEWGCASTPRINSAHQLCTPASRINLRINSRINFAHQWRINGASMAHQLAHQHVSRSVSAIFASPRYKVITYVLMEKIF